MKKWFIHILLLAGLFGMLTTSCSQDEALEQTGTTNGTVRIQFTLAMDGNAGSRAAADWGTETGGTENSPATDNRVAGDSYENMINLDQLQVFLFQGNKYLGEVGNLTLTPATSSKTYTFTGEITVKNATVTEGKLLNATIMVVANYEGYVNGNIAITQNYIFDYIADNYRPVVTGTTTTYGSYIPMWGILKPKNGIPLYESVDNDTFTPIGNIYMLRSLAKIEVELSNNVDDDYVIIGATLNKYNQKGYLLPAKFSATNNGTTTSSYFNASSTSAYDTEGCMNPYSSVDYTPLSFNVVDGGRSCVLYVPEYSSSTKDLSINLQISKNGTPISNKLEKKGTFTLDTKDLVRNHWYKCKVNQINDNTDLELTLTVNPWNLETTDLHYKTQGAAKQTIVWKPSGVLPNEDNEVVLDATHSTATFDFELSAPTGGIWYATLVPMGGDENAFSFDPNNIVTTISGSVGTPSGLRTIYAVNTSGVVEENNVARLEIIVVTSDGRSINLTDMLGEYTIMQANTKG